MKSLLLFFTTLMSLTSFGQQLIHGSISDNNEALPFATICIKNSTKGVMSDDYGNFTIEAKPTDTLQVSYLGYKPKSVVVGKKTQIEVILNDYEQLDTVLLYGYKYKSISCGVICTMTECYLDDEDKLEERMIETSESIKLFPNPSKSGVFNLKLMEDVSELHIVVADISGRIIVNTTQTKLNSNAVVDLSNQPSGLYIINLMSNGTKIASKRAIKI
ncbi:carboxypeptidase-like regulatory domain-containing protein [Psychroserpens algicola]|uniref:Carboxypeptidase-like regulatory domain-containing protein n=1 Tax=Psychroserpens algicola TaxID=1719034 RepID=A0ABT0H914_9FLAO|nr:carboxypeptidase-like regulatory domain-containing protein [Psychroserpens algicola]MCK8480851.1 carboxypeptidase-like regulatory domain-containing protein [Psychroserpens algicola]